MEDENSDGDFDDAADLEDGMADSPEGEGDGDSDADLEALLESAARLAGKKRPQKKAGTKQKKRVKCECGEALEAGGLEAACWPAGVAREGGSPCLPLLALPTACSGWLLVAWLSLGRV